jgi:hypothetical protein
MALTPEAAFRGAKIPKSLLENNFANSIDRTTAQHPAPCG